MTFGYVGVIVGVGRFVLVAVGVLVGRFVGVALGVQVGVGVGRRRRLLGVPLDRSKPLTVTDLTRHIKGALEAAFPPLWVEGEISDFKAAAS